MPQLQPVHLTSDGRLRYRLFAIEETDAPDSEIATLIRANLKSKWLNSQKFVPPPACKPIGG